MKTNQLLLSGVKSVAKLVFACLFGFVFGKFCAKTNPVLAFDVDEEIVSICTLDDKIGGELKFDYKNFAANDLIADLSNIEYTCGVLKEPEMNVQFEGISYHHTNQSRRTQKVNEKPLIPPPRTSLARSDILFINTS